MRISRFKLGFVLGYAVATVRHSKDADPWIQRLKSVEDRWQAARDWWAGLDEDHPIRRLAAQSRYAA